MNSKKQIVEEADANYEKAETDLLKEALKRTPAERYYMMTKLMKRGIMLNQVRITPYNTMKPQSK